MALSIAVEQARPGVKSYVQADGRRLHVLAEGRLVNLAGGDGHPAEIMDMSFALQALAVLYLAEHGRTLTPGVYTLPAEIDDQVAALLLKHKKRSIEVLTAEQAHYMANWDLADPE